MKKICLIIPLLAALIAVVACSKTSYNNEESATLVAKIQNGDSLTAADYSAMIEQAIAGLNIYEAALDTMNITSRESFDSAMKVLGGNPEFVKMINECLMFERVLPDAPLGDKEKAQYNKFLKKQVEFKDKYIK